MTKDLELRLIDAAVPDGEIVVKDLAALATALQELSTRISREILNTPGPGRTKQFMKEFAQLRLSGIEAGSTVLTFNKGPIDKLDVELAEQRVADERFWEIVEAIGQDRRPRWATDLVSESAAKLVGALRAAAPRARLSGSRHSSVEIESSRIRVETWTTRPLRTATRMEARGRLEKVDLRSHEFRVRDDVGQSVDLRHVARDEDAAQYLGQWVVATGEGILAAGQLVALDNVSLALPADPARDLLSDDVLTLDDLLASATGPDPERGIDLSEDEFVTFIEAARA